MELSIKKDDNFEEVIDYAMYLMNTSRKGPVHIDLPKDIMSNKYNIKESKMNNFIIPEIEKNYDNSKNISDLINLINVAHKPVIIAGNGCLDSYSELREFINKTKIPITSTLHAMGVYDERKPESLHMLGMHGSVYANYAVQNSDLVIAIGSRLDDRITGNVDGHVSKAHEAFKQKKGGLVHIDNCQNQIKKVKKIVNTDISIYGDTKEILNILNSHDYQRPIERDAWDLKIKNGK